MKSSDDYRTSLRLDRETVKRIELQCQQDGGKITMSAWLAQAIAEKLARDQERLGASARAPRAAYRFYEFFAGGGMARAGLGVNWQCLFANDFDPMKARVYRENWDGGHELLVDDINKIRSGRLPGEADLTWASFPCQDLSLAGNYEGIGHWRDTVQTRSGTFWPFWRLMRSLIEEGRAPKLIVLENVYGVLTSHRGRDFAAIGSAFTEAGYSFGAMVIDARHFVPQSRPRVFIIGVHADVRLPGDVLAAGPDGVWHPPGLVDAHRALTPESRKHWIWWNLAKPAPREQTFTDLIEDDPHGVTWNSPQQTQKILAMMSAVNKAKLRNAQRAGRRTVGGVYKRTRMENGKKVQRAEVRFDDIAGCLRTPAGGSSRQSILVVEGKKVRSRLLSPREAARLMGLPDTYLLPPNYNDAYHVAGDGVVVPVVRHLAKHLLEPILEAQTRLAVESKAA